MIAVYLCANTQQRPMSVIGHLSNMLIGRMTSYSEVDSLWRVGTRAQGMQLNVAEAEPHCSVPNSELRRNLPEACSLRAQPYYLIVIYYPARTPKLFTALTCVADAGAHALADQVTLKLGDGRDHTGTDE